MKRFFSQWMRVICGRGAEAAWEDHWRAAWGAALSRGLRQLQEPFAAAHQQTWRHSVSTTPQRRAAAMRSRATHRSACPATGMRQRPHLPRCLVAPLARGVLVHRVLHLLLEILHHLLDQLPALWRLLAFEAAARREKEGRRWRRAAGGGGSSRSPGLAARFPAI